MKFVLPAPCSSVLLREVEWGELLSALEELEDHPGCRIAYDRGLFELMSPSVEHEIAKKTLDRLVQALSDELDIEIRSAGSTTWMRADLLRAIEPDECYYLQSAPAIRDRWDIALPKDPPPDLVVEVEVTKRSVDRFSIYASLGMPEIWRYENGSVTAYQLREGEYREITNSLAWPGAGAGGPCRLRRPSPNT